MKIDLRLKLIILGASLPPILTFLACVAVFKLGYLHAVVITLVSAAFSAFFAARAILSGLALPMVKVSSGVKCFIAADYRLESVIKKEGWPEAASLISGLNRLMLELSAYRAFHLDQVVEDRAKAAALIETITDGVLLVDDRGRLVYSNRRALTMLGIEGQDPDIVLPGSVKQEAFSCAISGIMSSPENYFKAEVEVPVPGDPSLSVRGGLMPPPVIKNFRFTARQLVLATFKRPGRVITIRDVTLEKEIESARETLFYMITHDMRAPLSSIQGYAQLMRKSAGVSPEADKCLESILRSSIRLNGMIEDILNTIKLERGEMKLNPVVINAGDLCSRVLEMHKPLAARKNIGFFAITPSEKIEFNGDSVLLERVITNLVGNSLKFTPDGGTVSLSCRKVSGAVVFSVEDNGPGIPKEKHAEIFEKYAQLEEHKFMGFGLGLAMCRMAVELHKGRIWVESEEGKGSKFSFLIPVKQLYD